MAYSPSTDRPKSPRVSDLRGVAQLATQATAGLTRVAEGVHRAVWDSVGVPGGRVAGRTRGITGLVYNSVHDIALLVGKSVDSVLALLEARSGANAPAKHESLNREALIAALNGVIGDRLVAGNNPLALPMTLRYRRRVLNWRALPPMPEATSKVLVLIHGLCVSDFQVHTDRGGDGVADHGEALALALGYTPVYLRYNTGLHTSENGFELSVQLEHLVRRWPTPITELTVVAHSMGGLIIRSACHRAQQEALVWSEYLRNLVFLGTPHHGAALERAGSWVDVILGGTPYTSPFGRLGKLRSAGITDLRYGNVVEDDWRGHDRFHPRADDRRVVPLPKGVACHTVAASRAARDRTKMNRLVGDGLVPLSSALGRHTDSRRDLEFAEEATWIAYETSHMGLLSSPEVNQKMVRWLGSVGEQQV